MTTSREGGCYYHEGSRIFSVEVGMLCVGRTCPSLEKCIQTPPSHPNFDGRPSLTPVSSIGLYPHLFCAFLIVPCMYASLPTHLLLLPISSPSTTPQGPCQPKCSPPPPPLHQHHHRHHSLLLSRLFAAPYTHHAFLLLPSQPLCQTGEPP